MHGLLSEREKNGSSEYMNECGEFQTGAIFSRVLVYCAEIVYI
jgi:hypothetical protein